MADTVVATLSAAIEIVRKTTLDLSTVVDSSNALKVAHSYASGTASGQVDKAWTDARQPASAANDDLDLTALTQTIFGSTVTTTLAKVRAIIIQNLAVASGEDLLIGGSGGNEFSAPFGAVGDQVKCPAGSCLVLENNVAGWTVDGTHKLLRIHNSGSSTASYNIAIIGTSA